MSVRLTLVDVAEPHRLGSLVRQNLLRGEKSLLCEDDDGSREWAPLDRTRFRQEPENYQTKYADASLGRLRVVLLADRCATQFKIRSPVVEAFWVCVFERGGGKLSVPYSHEPMIADTSAGIMREDLPGTWSTASDGNSRLGMRIPAGHLRRKLEALLDWQNADGLAFNPVFDMTRGAGATIRRLIGSLFNELKQSDSLLTNEIAARSFEEHLMLCLLLGLRHNYSGAIHRQTSSCAPRNVNRAEEFMHVNVNAPVTIDAIANAAGCSVRALQIAFRRFRGMTPMAALQRFRLEAARADILSDRRTQSLASIAAAYGFTNSGRFSRLFRRTYGVYPSEARGNEGSLAMAYPERNATYFPRELPEGSRCGAMMENTQSREAAGCMSI